MRESRFEAGRSWKGTRLDSLARGLYDIADEGYQDKTAAGIIAEMRERLVGELLPLLQAAEAANVAFGKYHDGEGGRYYQELLEAARELRKELSSWQGKWAARKSAKGRLRLA